MTSAVMGSGAAKGVKGVRWSVARSIVVAWVLTLPAAAIVAALAFLITSNIIPQ
ncbi:MAG: inorganic phosphate transporter [Aeromicrobium sp.]